MTTITLPERLRIDTASDCWDELRSALDAGEDLKLNAAPVADIDAAGVQVLLMARQVAHQNARDFSLDGTGAVLAQAFQALGIPAPGAAGPHDHNIDSGEING